MRNKTDFHIKDFAPSLDLKKRLEAILRFHCSPRSCKMTQYKYSVLLIFPRRKRELFWSIEPQVEKDALSYHPMLF